MTDVTEPTTTPQPALAPSNSSLRDLTTGSSGLLLLLVLVFVCYARVSQGGYIWDDDAYVVTNSTLRSFGGLSRIWTDLGATPQYYPMTFTSFWLEVQAFGFSPKVSHVINFLLHAGSVILLWKLLQRLAVPGAWLAAAVFAVHPINVESVAWISERKNTLSMLLGLSAVWTYLRYAKIGVAPAPRPAGEGFSVPLPDDPTRLYRLFLILFALALLSKTTVSVLPGVLLVIAWWKRGRIGLKQDVLPLLPAFAMGLAAGLVTSYVEHSPYYIGATGADWQIGIAGRLLLVGQTAAFYFWKIVWPFPVGYSFATGKWVWPFAPSFNYYRWTLDPQSPLQWLPLAGVAGVVIALWALRGKIGRGPLACALVFLGGLLPASGLFTFFPMRYSWVADHFAYLGGIGLIVGLVAVLARVFADKPQFGATLAGIVLAGFVILSVWEASAFDSLRSLWERTWKQSDRRSWLTAINYGVWCMDEANNQYVQRLAAGDDTAASQRDDLRDKAEKWLRAGLQIKPTAIEAYTALGTLSRQRGDLNAAVGYYRKAADMAAEQGASGYQLPAFQLGETLAQKGDVPAALAVFDQIEPLEARLSVRNPGLFASMHTERGNLIMRQIKSPLGPTMPDADRALLNDAIVQYVRATELAPDFIPPKLRLASLLGEIGNGEEAFQQINDVLRLDRDNVEAKMLTAHIASAQGQYPVAAVQLQNVLQLNPRFLPAHLELAKAYRAMNRWPDAVAELEATVKAMPEATVAKQLLAEMKAQAATQPSATQPAGATPMAAPGTPPMTPAVP